ncbi:MAG: 30S ribosomal protein S5 [Candidatus Aenigmarchaeota archaeon]|nr:30S ribosomal protein S5 [Candidatus Aenigmarchaeota archaeon]
MALADWSPKTELGQKVLKKETGGLDSILSSGQVILEPEIVDFLMPELKTDVVYIGGSPGKGGGIRRTATRRTARMHKSGRRYKLSAMVVIGNENGIVGLGKASSREHRTAIEKATTQAKLSVIRVRRGCGNWECVCNGTHSIPFRTSAKTGSVTVTISPAPKGVGLVANKPVRNILMLAGIKDAWVATEGQTQTRTNLMLAVFAALKSLNKTKGDI